MTHYGSLEKAAGGTLLLDEVADMDLEAQAQLLGALDSGSFLRVGGTEPVGIDVRIVAVTQRNLEDEVRAGRFREDLFYHLNVVPLNIPRPARPRRGRSGPAELLSRLLRHPREAALPALQRRRPELPAQLPLAGQCARTQEPGPARPDPGRRRRDHPEGGREHPRGATAPRSRPRRWKAWSPSTSRCARRASSSRRPIWTTSSKSTPAMSARWPRRPGMERTHLYRKLRSLGIEIKERR